MPRGYRYVILAAFGLLIGATQPHQASRAKEDKPASEQRADQAAPPSLPPIIRTLSADDPDIGCKRGQDDRASDLCAQWKAADAAYDAARWGWWQMVFGAFGLIVGGGTLIAAVWAAIYAKAAAKAANDTLEHEKIIAGLQINAVLHIESVDITRPRNIQSHNISFELHNAGQLPAKNLKVSGAWGYRTDAQKEPLILQPCNAPKGLSQGKQIDVILPMSENTDPRPGRKLFCQFVVNYESRPGEQKRISEIHQFNGTQFFRVSDD